MLGLILSLIALLGIILGSFTDIRTREVPDWINYSLVVSGLGLRLIYSFVFNEASYIIDGITGFLLFFGIACLMFYTGQWGGGDSKMLMGVGALLGLPVSLPLSQMISNWTNEPPLLLLFLLYSLVFGAVYGLIWSLGLAVINRKAFSKEFRLISTSYNKMKWILIISLVILFFVTQAYVESSALSVIIYGMSIIFVIMLYLLIFIKAIEKTCMIRSVDPKNLTVGDWIVEDIKYKGEIIAAKKDLGLQQKQIDKLIKLKNKGIIKKVIIKIGIPFVPSFLISMIITIWFGANLIYFLF